MLCPAAALARVLRAHGVLLVSSVVRRPRLRCTLRWLPPPPLAWPFCGSRSEWRASVCGGGPLESAVARGRAPGYRGVGGTQEGVGVGVAGQGAAEWGCVCVRSRLPAPLRFASSATLACVVRCRWIETVCDRLLFPPPSPRCPPPLPPPPLGPPAPCPRPRRAKGREMYVAASACLPFDAAPLRAMQLCRRCLLALCAAQVCHLLPACCVVRCARRRRGC